MSSCKFEIINGQKFRKKVRAFIINENNELLLIRPKHYKSDVWSFVGGGVDENESTEESVIREIKEEAGIEKIISIKKSKHINKYDYKPEYRTEYKGQIAYYFVVQVKSDEEIKIQNDEISDFCWVKLDEVHNYVKIKEQFDFFALVAEEFELDLLKKSS